MAKVYIETSVISYFIADRSDSIKIAGHQLSTISMWRKIPEHEVYVSDIVVEEASKGDEEKAALRLDAIKDFQILGIDDRASNLAKLLLSEKAIPHKCPEDALHIAIASVNEMDFIVTWNFSHINNPFMKNRIRKTIENAAYNCPIICSPDEILGEDDE